MTAVVADLDPVKVGEGIAAVLGAFGGVYGGLRALRPARRRKARERAQDIEELWEKFDEVRGRMDVAMTYIYELHEVLRENGIDPPRPPKELRVRRASATARTAAATAAREDNPDDDHE